MYNLVPSDASSKAAIFVPAMVVFFVIGDSSRCLWFLLEWCRRVFEECLKKSMEEI